jgi:uncharacterized protein YndB with AHSA1/START domain
MAANSAASSPANPSSAPPFAPQGELVLTRTFDAPRDLVFKLWTEKEHLEKWWGPAGFTTTVHENEVRPGGASYYTMRGPDGNDYPFRGKYLEVVPPEKLVTIGAIHEGTDQQVWTETLFTERGAKTHVRIHQLYSFESFASKGAPIGWSMQLDRLEKYLVAL